MATHSSLLAWRIPRTEGPAGLQSTGSWSRSHLATGNKHTGRICPTLVATSITSRGERENFKMLFFTMNETATFFFKHEQNKLHVFPSLPFVLLSVPFYGVFVFNYKRVFPCGSADKTICLQCRRPGFDPWGWEDPMEKGKATHSNILAWRIPSTLYSLGSQRVGRD